MKACVGADHDDAAAAIGKQHRRYGAQTVECAGQVRVDDLVPGSFRLADQQAALGDSCVADECGCGGSMTPPGVDHPLDRVGLPNIRLIQIARATLCQNLSERGLRRRLVSAIVDADMPSNCAERKADCAADTTGRTGNEHGRTGLHLNRLGLSRRFL